jgi:ferritin
MSQITGNYIVTIFNKKKKHETFGFVWWHMQEKKFKVDRTETFFDKLSFHHNLYPYEETFGFVPWHMQEKKFKVDRTETFFDKLAFHHNLYP